MITRIGAGSFASPTFKANICLQVGHDTQTTIDDATVYNIEKQFKQIGNHQDYFEHTYNYQKGNVSHRLEYYNENNKEKRVRFELTDDNYLTPAEALKILTKAIIAKEPITSQDSNKITREVLFPEFDDFDVNYSKQHSQSEDNFYYRNGKKSVCVQNITPYKSIAEYYDKNGNLKFKKYKNLGIILTEKYNSDGQISYRVISGETDIPIVIKDNKMFQMYAYDTQDPRSGFIAPDNRILVERDNNKSLKYYLDSSQAGIRPEDAPSHDYYRLYHRNKYSEKMNQVYAQELMKINSKYSPEHLKELYLFPHDFNKEFIEDNTIFNTNYRIDLIDSNLKPNTEKLAYSSICWSSQGDYNYDTIRTKACGNSIYKSKFELPYKYNIFSQFKFFDNLWDNATSQFQIFNI